MRIAHVCLTSPYTQGYSYHENILPKYQSLFDNEIKVYTTEFEYNDYGDIIKNNEKEFIDNNVKVIRLLEKKKRNFQSKFKYYKDLYEELCMFEPDMIFFHGCQSLNLLTVARYKRSHLNCILFVDNHADFSNSAKSILSYRILHKIIWKTVIKKTEKWVDKFYGVMPSRVKFLSDVYSIDIKKIDLLMMGADDLLIENINKEEEFLIRENLEIDENDFVIVTGGKIDQAKRQTLELIKAVDKLKKYKCKLIIFGIVDSSINDEFLRLIKKVENVYFIGKIDSKKSYLYFDIADLVCFPGRHSVYWEQATALGKPMLIRNWELTNHVDVGNCIYLENANEEEIRNKIENLLTEPNLLETLKTNGEKYGFQRFSSEAICKKMLIDIKEIQTRNN